MGPLFPIVQLGQYDKLNIVCLLRKREEYGSLVYQSRLNYSMMKRIISSSSYEYKKVFEYSSTTKIDYYNKNIITSKGKSLYKIKNDNKLEMVRKFNDNVIDFLIFDPITPTNFSNIQEQNYEAGFLSLEKQNILKLYDLQRANLKKTFFITPHFTTANNSPSSKSPKFTLKGIQWNKDSEDIICKGKSFKANLNLLRSNTEEKFNDVFYLFRLYPLRFYFSFQIDEKPFLNSKSKDDSLQAIIRTDIGEDILLVMFNRYVIRLYNLNWVIENSANTPKSSSEDLNVDSFGLDETGIPLICILKEQPPILYEVQSYNHLLRIGSVPLHALYCDVKQKNKMSVFNIENKTLTGTIELENQLLDSEQVIFHPDQKGAIINFTEKALSIFDIEPDEVKSEKYNERFYRLRETFKVNFMNEIYSKKSPEKTENTQSKYVTAHGREVQRKNYTDNFDELFRPNPEVSFNYEHNLNLFGIIIVADIARGQEAQSAETNDDDQNEDEPVQDTSEDILNGLRLPFMRRHKKRRPNRPARSVKNRGQKTPNFLIQLYDNSNGKLLRKFFFSPVKKNSFINSYQLYIDFDYLIVIEKCFQYCIYVFNLNALSSD